MLASELGVAPGAETRALYEQIRQDRLRPGAEEGNASSDSSRAAAPVAPRLPPHNLPAALTPFLGRQLELQRLDRLLADEAVRLVSITGIGGMGKTRLAIEAGQRHTSKFRDGVFLVSLAQVDTSSNIPNAIADAIGFQFYSTEAPLQQVARYLRPKQMLLILDNFDHLATGAAMLFDILRLAPQIKIVVTSRTPLRLRGETLLNLSGMKIQSWRTAAEASRASVVQLLVQSAQRVQPDFRLGDDNLQAALAICRQVQGMPLGVELAASWAHAMTLAEIAQGIAAEADVLASDFRDIPARHRSLQIVLDQSLHLLGEAERRTFAKLCVFRGGFTREAAREVAGAEFPTLTALANKSLLQRDTTGRYTIHELLRRFGETCLPDGEDGDVGVRDEHARYYCHFLAGLDAELNLGEGRRACHQIEIELGNVRLAWEWACGQGMFERLINAEYALFLFREYQNRFQEMEQMYETARRYVTPLPASPQRDHFLSCVLRSQAWTALRFGQIERGLDLAVQGWESLAAEYPAPAGSERQRSPGTAHRSLHRQR